MPAWSLTFCEESWPIADGFSISRGTKTHAKTILITLTTNTATKPAESLVPTETGRGEIVPYSRYGETTHTVLAQLQQVQKDLLTLRQFDELGAYIAALAPGSARNGLDCAYLDLLFKTEKQKVSEHFSLPQMRPIVTAYTISLRDPDLMAAQAVKAAKRFQLIKLKLGGGDGLDIKRLKTIRSALPTHRLIIDANEGWSRENVEVHCALCDELNIELIEQPLPQNEDSFLTSFTSNVPLCADESFKTSADFKHVTGKYEVVNIKLDKTGGLREAVQAVTLAQEHGFEIMIGCMVSTSLAIAPIMALTPLAKWVDLDAPTLLTKDREGGLHVDDKGLIHPPQTSLWG